jgi:hypothetical protein
MVVSAAYAGSRGSQLYRWIEGNPTFPSATVDGRRFWTGDEPRRNPNWSNIDLVTAIADSWYDSLQLEVRKQLTGGLQFQSSYTWAKAIDTTQGQQPGEHGGSGRAVDPLDPRTDRGPADFDTRHSWTVNALYQLPSPGLGGFGGILDGWQLGSILSVRTGLPFSVMLSGNRSRTESGGNNPDRPDLVPGRTPDDIILGGPDRYFDPGAFAIQPVGFLGTSSKNFLEGPHLVNVDLSFHKSTPVGWLGGAGRIEFRAEFFNLLNHANFNIPNDGRTVYTADATRATPEPLPTAGQIDRTTTSSRQIQLALRLVF